jgi:hypothetical protein
MYVLDRKKRKERKERKERRTLYTLGRMKVYYIIVREMHENQLERVDY